MNIVLIGYRGSGKSSIGARLAALMYRHFVDSDAVIVQTAAKTIREIFEVEGEPGFRRREHAAIASLAKHHNRVIALGGGAILNPENISALKRDAGATVVWLHAEPEVLHARIQADAATNATRPNLTAAGGLAEVQKLLLVRTPLYQAAADVTLDVGTLSVEQATAELMRLLAKNLPKNTDT